MNWIQTKLAQLECAVVGHKLHSEATIKDHDLFTIYQHLITCSNCGKFFYHDSRTVENKEAESKPTKSADA